MAQARQLVASGHLAGVDHERLAPNEMMHLPVYNKIVLTTEEVPQSFATWKQGWGGECRIEVTLTAKLISEKRIIVDMNGKLFEGDSESTTDLAEEKTESFVVVKNLP